VFAIGSRLSDFDRPKLLSQRKKYPDTRAVHGRLFITVTNPVLLQTGYMCGIAVSNQIFCSDCMFQKLYTTLLVIMIR